MATPSTCCCSRKTRTSASSTRPRALDLADRLQTPVFLMTDLDIGMNQRLCQPFAWDDGRGYDRGKVMTAEELEAGSDFGRYKDVDGDGIPWRTLPGTHPTKGSFFTRGTTRDAYARYSERGPDYVYNMERLLKKFADRRRRWCRSRCCGRAARKTRAGRDLLRLDQPGDARGAGRARRSAASTLDALRLRAFPFPESVAQFIAEHDAGVRGRAEPRRPDAQPAGQRARRSIRRGWSGCCISTARRSPRASSPRPSPRTCSAPAGAATDSKETA